MQGKHISKGQQATFMHLSGGNQATWTDFFEVIFRLHVVSFLEKASLCMLCITKLFFWKEVNLLLPYFGDQRDKGSPAVVIILGQWTAKANFLLTTCFYSPCSSQASDQSTSKSIHSRK